MVTKVLTLYAILNQLEILQSLHFPIFVCIFYLLAFTILYSD